MAIFQWWTVMLLQRSPCTKMFRFECMERAKTQAQKATSLQPSIGRNASAEVAAVAAEESPWTCLFSIETSHKTHQFLHHPIRSLKSDKIAKRLGAQAIQKCINLKTPFTFSGFQITQGERM